jgi:hypothetical protein
MQLFICSKNNIRKIHNFCLWCEIYSLIPEVLLFSLSKVLELINVRKLLI